MANTVRLSFPFAQITGEFDGVIFRKNQSGTISCYPKPKRNLEQHPVTDSEIARQNNFKRIAAMASEIEKDPEQLAKHQIAYEVFCSVKHISMHAYLMKVCNVILKKQNNYGND